MHDRDAGGEPALLEGKAAIREEVWAALKNAGVARFPGARGRIPNFTGAEAAAERLTTTDAWQRASRVKANPDSPQWPVRQRALEHGKLVFMAVPRLAEEEPFFCLDPAHLEASPRKASSIKGASKHAQRVAVEALGPVELVITGCVAVGRDGVRLGKGGGFSDLELALAAEAGLVDEQTVVATTVHPLQLRDGLPEADHDIRVDLVITPDEVIETGAERRPLRLDPAILTEAKIAAIPLLKRLLRG